MKTPILNQTGPAIPSHNAEAELDAIDSFRAWLQTVVTAGQFGQNDRLPRLPRSRTTDYCRALASLPDNALANELALPVLAVIDQIDYAAAIFQRALPPVRSHVNGLASPPVAPPISAAEQSVSSEQAAYEKILGQLDLALVVISRRLAESCQNRGRYNRPDFVREV